MDQETQMSYEDRSGMIIGGIIVLGVGLLFLLVNLEVLPGLGTSWPGFIVIVGLALIIGALFKKKKA